MTADEIKSLRAAAKRALDHLQKSPRLRGEYDDDRIALHKVIEILDRVQRVEAENARLRVVAEKARLVAVQGHHIDRCAIRLHGNPKECDCAMGELRATLSTGDH